MISSESDAYRSGSVLISLIMSARRYTFLEEASVLPLALPVDACLTALLLVYFSAVTA